MRRWLRIGCLALPVLIIATYFIAKSYLASRVTPEVVARLQSALGMRVQIADADVGLSGGSELHDVQVFEPAPPATSASTPAAPRPPERPWFRVKRIEADVSVLSLLSGSATPSRVRLEGVAVILRFDKDGNLLTPLPSARGSAGQPTLPTLVIEDGQLTIEQVGRAPFAVQGIHGTLTGEAGGLKIAGDIKDPFWGDWQIGGQVPSASGAIKLSLDTPKTEVTAEKLQKLPFVPPSVWLAVQPKGTTSARLTLAIATKAEAGSKADNNHVKVELTPTDAQVRVAAIELDASGVSGKVVVEDQLVTLSGVTGLVADGTMKVDGTLDFRRDTSAFNLSVDVSGLAIPRLPRSWDLPEALDGKLTGSARLLLRLTEPLIQTEGSSGEGTVTGVSVLGLGKGEAKLYLHPGPGRFSFRREPPPQKKVAVPDPASVVALLTPPGAVPGAKGPPKGPVPEIGRTLDLASHGLSALSNALVRGAAAFLQRLRNLDQPAPPGKAPTYFEANLSLQDVDLGELVRRAKLTLPFAVSGQLSFNLNVGFPVDTPRDFKAYRFNGEARLPRLNLAGLEMANVRTRLRYENGELILEALHGEASAPGLPAGSFDGTARYQLIPVGDLTATLRFDRFPPAAVGRLVPFASTVAGSLSGTLQFKAPGGRLGEPSSWQAAGLVHGDSLGFAGATLRRFSATVTLIDGSAELKDFKGELEGARITGSAKLRLTEDYPFESALAAPGLDLAFLERIDPAFRPPLPVKGRVDFTTNLKGTLRPLEIGVSGTARSADVTVQSTRLTSLSLRYALAAGRVSISDIRAGMYGGAVSGSATLPLRPAESGEASLQFDHVDLGDLARNLPAVPVTLDGVISGTVSGKLLATAGDRPREMTAAVDLSAPDLRIQGIPTRRVRGNLTYRNGSGAYKLECELAGGTFKIEGPLTPVAAPPTTPSPPQSMPAGIKSGVLQLRDVFIGRLLATTYPGRPSPLRGRLSVDLPFRFEGPDQRPTGRGEFTVAGVRWGDSTITDRLQGAVRLAADGLSLSDASATLGGGDLRLSAGYSFARGGRIYLNIELFHVEASRLLAPFPALAGLAEGSTDVSIRVSGGGGGLRGGGRAVLARGRILGLEVTDWRVPIEIAFTPAGGGQLDVRDSSAQIARGRAQGRLSLTWGDTTRLDGSVRFFEADLHALLGRGSEAASYAGGQLNGTLDFGAENLQTADDLNATLTATLRQTRAGGMPVVDQVMPFISVLGGSGATRFETGDILARLTRGIFRIQRFTLSSTVLQLILEGDVTLAGRLNLEVTAGTSYLGVNARGFQLLGLRLPAIGSLPLALIVDASAFLANRVVHLRITGTYANPSVRVEPTALLSQESVRFFLSRTGLPVTP